MMIVPRGFAAKRYDKQGRAGTGRSHCHTGEVVALARDGGVWLIFVVRAGRARAPCCAVSTNHLADWDAGSSLSRANWPGLSGDKTVRFAAPRVAQRTPARVRCGNGVPAVPTLVSPISPRRENRRALLRLGVHGMDGSRRATADTSAPNDFFGNFGKRVGHCSSPPEALPIRQSLLFSRRFMPSARRYFFFLRGSAPRHPIRSFPAWLAEATSR